MKKIILANTANFIVLLRSALVFMVILFFNLDLPLWKIIGLAILVFITILDWLDGYVARRCNISSKLGGLIDTLGDRITENCLLIFFAYKQLVPVAAPIIFVSRSFVADFVRSQAYQCGIDTFSINKSALGVIFVASKASRVLYLVFKMAVFFLGGVILVVESFIASGDGGPVAMATGLRQAMFYGAVFLVLFNLLRFILLIYDSRFILKKTFAA